MNLQILFKRPENLEKKKTSLPLAWLPLSLLTGLIILLVAFFPSAGIFSGVTKQFWAMIFVIIVMFGWLIQQAVAGQVFVAKTAVWWGLGGMVLSTILSGLFATSPHLALIGQGVEVGSALTIIVFALSAFLFAQACAKKIWARTIASVLLGVVTVSVIFYVVRILTGGSFGNLGVLPNVYNTVFGSWFDFGIFVTITTSAMMMYSTADAVSRWLSWQKILWYVALVINVIGIIVVGIFSSYVIVGAIAMVAFLYRVYLAQKNNTSMRVPVHALIIFILMVGAIFFYHTIQSGVEKLAKNNIIHDQPSVRETIDMSHTTLSSRPILGYGPLHWHQVWGENMPMSAQQAVYQAQYRTTGTGYGLSIFTTQGIIGLLAYTALVVLFIWNVIVYVRKLKKPELALAISTGAIIGLLYMTIAQPGFVMTMLVFMLIGMSIALLHRSHDSVAHIALYAGGKKALWRALGILIAIIIIIALVIITGKNLRAFTWYKDIVTSTTETTEVAKMHNRVRRLSDFHPHDTYQRLRATMLATELVQQGQSDDAEMSPEELRALFAEVHTSYQRALAYNPFNTQTWYSFAQLYGNLNTLGVEQSGQTQQQLLQQTLNVHRGYVPALTDLARIAAEYNQSEQALEYVRAVLERTRSYAPIYQVLALLASQEGETGAVQAYLQQSLRLQPNQPFMWFQLGVVAMENSDYNQAVRAFEATIQLRPFVEAYGYLVDAYEADGRNTDAENLRAQMIKQGLEVPTPIIEESETEIIDIEESSEGALSDQTSEEEIPAE